MKKTEWCSSRMLASFCFSFLSFLLFCLISNIPYYFADYFVWLVECFVTNDKAKRACGCGECGDKVVIHHLVITLSCLCHLLASCLCHLLHSKFLYILHLMISYNTPPLVRVKSIIYYAFVSRQFPVVLKTFLCIKTRVLPFTLPLPLPNI